MTEKRTIEPTFEVIAAAELTAVEGGMVGPPPQFPPYGGCIPRPGQPIPMPKLPPLGPIGKFPA